MKLIEFYKKIEQKKIKYFFRAEDIYKFISKNYKNFFFKNSSILELGCGNLENYKYLKKFKYKKYTAVDWINFDLKVEDRRLIKKIMPIEKYLNTTKENFDLIFLIGTLEHFNKPIKLLKLIKKRLNKNGKLLLSYANYYNPRGLVLLTLKNLVDMEVSLSDKYEYAPDELETFLKKLNFVNITSKSIRNSAGYQNLAVKDLKQRLPKVIKNLKPTKLQTFIKNFKNYSKNYIPNTYSGQIILIDAKLK